MGEKFKFKSTKGQEASVDYTPSSAVKISDKGAFQKYLLKIVDFLQVEDKKAEAKADKPKTIEAVAGITQDKGKEDDEKSEEL